MVVAGYPSQKYLGMILSLGKKKKKVLLTFTFSVSLGDKDILEGGLWETWYLTICSFNKELLSTCYVLDPGRGKKKGPSCLFVLSKSMPCRFSPKLPKGSIRRGEY